MQNNVRRSRMQPTQVISLDTARQILNEGVQNPISAPKVLEGDGGAFRAYNYKLFNKH